jgi:type VI secretion system VasD/TssJ family lipoprotein
MTASPSKTDAPVSIPRSRVLPSSLQRALGLWPAILALKLCALLFGCGGGGPDPMRVTPQWKYDPNGGEFRVRADPLLNLYDNQGHTLVLCVYQLSDPNKFLSLAKTRDGLVTLLQCDKAFDDSAVTFQKMIIQPGDDFTQSMARAEKATAVGVAGGYFDLDPARSTRLFTYPVIERDTGVLTRDMVRKPGKLVVNLFLGPTEIQKVGSD